MHLATTKGEIMIKQKFGALLVAGVVVCGLVATLGLAGCGGGGSKDIQIFAANSLEQAMPLVQELYTAQHPEVTFADSQFKGSGDLVQQILAGAKPDILITASNGTMDDAASFIVPESRVSMFGNDLVLVAAQGSSIKVNDLTDLKGKGIKRIAIGDPGFVPAGKYANQSLYAADHAQPLYSSAEGEGGAYDKSIADKIAVASQVGTCAQWVSSGSCDVGFVYSSDLFRYTGIENIYTVPEEMHKAIMYPGAVLADSKNQDVAEDFLKFCMTDPGALAIWQENGFELK